jgi:hypothetical protein
VASKQFPVRKGLLAVASGEALFITWTRIDNVVAGTLYTSFATSSPPRDESLLFTGVIHGSLVTLTPRSGNNWNGTLNRSGVTLTTVESDGRLETFDFHPASDADYRAAAAGARAASSRAPAARTVRAQPLDRAQASLDAEVATVDRGLQKLRSSLEAARSDALSMSNLLAVERRDAATTSRDLHAPAADVETACTRAGRLYQDARSVQGDAMTVTGATKAFELAVKTVHDDSAQLRSDLRGLQVNRTGPRGDHRPDVAVAAAVALVLSDLQATLNALHRTIARELTQAEEVRAKATAGATRARRTCAGLSR